MSTAERVSAAGVWRSRRQRGSLHDGSVNHRLYVVPPVTRVDHSLSLRLPDDLLPLEDPVEPHVGRFRLRRGTQHQRALSVFTAQSEGDVLQTLTNLDLTRLGSSSSRL